MHFLESLKAYFHLFASQSLISGTLLATEGLCQEIFRLKEVFP
jgi:hypothetical protein